MNRVVVVVCFTLVTCDRGSKSPPPAPPPPPMHDPVPADAATPSDATVVDADTVDAIVLAPPRPAVFQKRDCGKAAKSIGRMFGGDNQEKRETDSATRKACIDAPWSATVIDCAVNAKGDDNPYDCTLLLPDDQQKAWHKATKEVFCKYNDCIPDGFRPGAAPGSDDDLGL